MLTCKQIADRINIYLKKFEKDPIINKVDEKYQTRRYYFSSAWGTTKVNIRYVNYQYTFKLSKEEGLRYLEWLDKGNIGEHYLLEKSI